MATRAYGPVFTTDQIKKLLKDQNVDAQGNSIWNNAIDSATSSYYKSSELQDKYYRDALTSAYSSYEKNKRLIQNYDILGSSKESLLASQQQALSQAYSSSQKQYYENINSAYENLNTTLSSIDKELTTKAENAVNYFNMFENYYDYIKENYGDILANESNYRDLFMHYDNVLGRDVWYDWSELMYRGFDETDTGEGIINDTGKAIFDFLENYEATPKDRTKEIREALEGLQSFNKFLAEQNPELYKWAFDADYTNYTEGGRNINSLKQLTGRDSNDIEWSYLEHLGVMKTDELKEALKEGNAEKVENFVNSRHIESYMNDITEREYGVPFSEFLDQYKANIKYLNGTERITDDIRYVNDSAEAVYIARELKEKGYTNISYSSKVTRGGKLAYTFSYVKPSERADNAKIAKDKLNNLFNKVLSKLEQELNYKSNQDFISKVI